MEVSTRANGRLVAMIPTSYFVIDQFLVTVKLVSDDRLLWEVDVGSVFVLFLLGMDIDVQGLKNECDAFDILVPYVSLSTPGQ